MIQVSVNCFGPWSLEVDGIVVDSLQSRMARELLVLVSIGDGSFSREQLIDELWPDEIELSRGRRRLSQEMNKIQTLVGHTLWFATRDTVGLHAECKLTSDVGLFLAAADVESQASDNASERARLGSVLQLTGRGQLLSGHTSEWSETIRGSVERHEARLLRRAISLLSGGDSDDALRFTRRLAALDPYDDAAHAQVLPLLIARYGHAAAEDYYAEIERRYVEDLGSPPSRSVRQAMTSAPGHTKHPLWVTIDRLKDEYQNLRTSEATNGELVAIITEIDDHLRIAGDYLERREILEDLQSVGGDPIDTARRLADVALASCDVRTVADLVESQGELNPEIESCAWLALASCQMEEIQGSYDSARVSSEKTITAVLHPEVRVEAHLLASRILASLLDIHAAEQAALQALAAANSLTSSYYRAAALVRLAWIRIRVGDHISAEQYLSESLEIAQQIGAQAIEAEALGTRGYYHGQNNKYGSALDSTRLAAKISERIGDTRSEMRWRLNTAVVAIEIGDIETVQAELDVVSRTLTGGQSEATAINLETVNNDLLWLQKDFETWLKKSEADALRLVAQGSVYGAFMTYLFMPFAYIELDRAMDAVEAAEAAIAYGASHQIPRHILMRAHASRGAALTNSGDPAAGIACLRQVMSETQSSLAAPQIVIYWLHAAATQLGLAGEAAAAKVQATELVRNIRSDLSDAQWQTAITNNLDLQRIASLCETN